MSLLVLASARESVEIWAQDKMECLYLIQMGRQFGYALFNLQARGRLFVEPGDLIYEGMVVGLHSRSNDLTVNPAKEKN